MIDDTIILPVVCVVCIANITAMYSAYIALAYLLKMKRALLACDQEEMVCDEESPRVEDNDPELPHEESPVVLVQDANQVASLPSVSHPMKTRGILRKPRYSSTFNQDDLGIVSPLTIDEANELWNSFASCKSTPSPSVEMPGILRKPRYSYTINRQAVAEAMDSFASCKSTPSPSVEMRGILKKPRYSNTINPRTMDKAKDSFASCKSTPNPSVEMRGILRKPRYTNNINPRTTDKAKDSFASCKSTPNPSVEMRGILRKPRYTNNINPRTTDKAKDSFASCKSSSSLSHPRLQLHGSDLGDCEWLKHVDVQKLERGIKPEAIAFFRKISRSRYMAEKIRRKRRWRKYENDWQGDEAFCGLVELFKEPVQSSLDLDKAENKFDKPLFRALSQEFVEVEVEVTNDLPVVPDDGQEEATIAVDELAGDYGSAEEPELVERTQTAATQARVRRSLRIAALQRVDYSATRRSVRRSPRLARLPRVDYKE